MYTLSLASLGCCITLPYTCIVLIVRPFKVAVLSFCNNPNRGDCFTYITLTWLTFLYTCSPLVSDCSNLFRSRCSILLIKGAMRGQPFCWFPGNQWANSHHVLPAICCPWWDAPPRPWFRCIRSLHPFKPLMSKYANSEPLLRYWSWASTGLVGLWGIAQQLFKIEIYFFTIPSLEITVLTWSGFW